MTDIFKDILPSIQSTGKSVIDAENEKSYVPFVVNRALSFHYDMILYANEMNKLPNTPRLMQYHFLLNTIRKCKRPFRKWQKNIPPDNIEAVKTYYKFSNEKAKEALSILTPAQIEIIKQKTMIGGSKNDKSRGSNMGKTTRT